MPLTTKSSFTWWGIALCTSLLSGCIFVGDFDDFHEVVPKSPTYGICFQSTGCFSGDYCEELALPADLYTDYVNAICTFECFDDLDCPVSDFNLLPGACVDHALLGAPTSARICLERCEVDADCDVAAGFGCVVIARDRVCAPIQ
jgi:hypothetical protein